MILFVAFHLSFIVSGNVGTDIKFNNIFFSIASHLKRQICHFENNSFPNLEKWILPNLKPSSNTAKALFYKTWSETLKTDFLASFKNV